MSVFPDGHALTLTGLADNDAEGYRVLERALRQFVNRHQPRPGQGSSRSAAIAEDLLEQVNRQQPRFRPSSGRGFLLGHMDEVEAFWTPADDAAGGLSPVLRIVGPPLSGKTTLAARVAAQAEQVLLATDDPSPYLASCTDVQRLSAEQMLGAPPHGCELLVVDSNRPAIQRWGSRMAGEARAEQMAVILVDIPQDSHGVPSQGVCASLVVPGLGTLEVPRTPPAAFTPIRP